MRRIVSLLTRRRRYRQRDRGLPELIEGAARSFRGGSSLHAALRNVSVDVEGEPARELRAALARGDQGEPLLAAVGVWAARSPARLMVAAAIAVGHQAGGEAAYAFDALAASLRQREAAQREVEVMAAQARAQAWVIAAAPGGFAAVMALVDPRTITAVGESGVALASVLAGVALQGAAFGWMRRLVRP